MKKIISFLTILLLFTGCTDLSNTPTKKSEAFFKKYQSLDNNVLVDLNGVITANSNMNQKQKDIYRDIMKKHYQNLTYEIKDETIDGNSAVVNVEISVTDFKKVIDEADAYLLTHKEEFNNDKKEYDASKFMDYRLEQLKKAKDKVKYTLHLSFTKTNKEWTLDKLDSVTYDKINGVYNY
ncbi:MAG: membrane lipoprotein lipid attachment site-containing protein [Bacilli bacterium]